MLGDGIYALLRPNTMLRLGKPPIAIDIVNCISGVPFEEAWRGRLRRRIDGRMVGFLGRAEFVKNKRAAAKENPARAAKDLADVALLEEIEAAAAPPRPPRRRRP